MADNHVTVHIDGLDALDDKLRDLPLKVAKKAMRDALRPAASVWREEMKSEAHRLTGWMASQIRVSVRTNDRDHGQAKVSISTKQNPDRHQKHVPGARNEALWNEFGTSKMAAQPFIRPSFEAKKDTVLDTLVTKLREILDGESR